MGQHISLSFSSCLSVTTHGGNNKWFSSKRTQFMNKCGSDLGQSTNTTAAHSNSYTLTGLEQMLRIRMLHLLVHNSGNILDRWWNGRVVAHSRHRWNGDRVKKLM